MLLGGAEDKIGGGVLEIAEGRTVNGVEDEGNAGAARGEAAENAGLAAVGVNNVGPGPPENFREPAQRAPVLPRMDGPNQFRDARQEVRRGAELGFQRTFRAGRGTGKQSNGDPGVLTETEDRRKA